MRKIPLITILGCTATGKTALAARLAARMGTAVISADSRQVYRRMDIGTGKDLADFVVGPQTVPYHLIDIAEPGEEYNLFRFVNDFKQVFQLYGTKENPPVLCGGSGLFLQAVLSGYQLVTVSGPTAEDLSRFSDEQIVEQLQKSGDLHNTTDLLDRGRMEQALRIRKAKAGQKAAIGLPPIYPSPVFGIAFDRPVVRARISARLRMRLEQGMVQEVQNLLDEGLQAGQLMHYGLEYKYVTQYLIGELNFEQMSRLLETAIHQFAKRQMTWFRRMQKQGIDIHWLDGMGGSDKMLDEILMKIS